MRKLLVAAALVAVTLPLVAQESGKGVLGTVGALSQEVKRAPLATGPAPRLPDGTIDLNGLWVGGGPVGNVVTQGGMKMEDLPILPAAKKIMESRKEEEDPHYFCMPMGVPRSTPYPFRFVQNYTHRKPTHMFILHEGNIHSYRQIFMDGRPHPKDPDPTWFGHSVGRFEGDTLVIDTVGFNDRFWFDFAGHPHTEKLHTIERYRRPEFGKLLYEVTIDDPGAYTKPFTLYGEHAYETDTELMEYICNENNQDVEHIVGKDPRNKYTKP